MASSGPTRHDASVGVRGNGEVGSSGDGAPGPSRDLVLARPVVRTPGPGVAEGPTVDPFDVDIRVVHASLEYARHMLIVGHYRGAEVTGAEASLDARLQGRLSRRHVARLYPEELGDAEAFDNRRENGGTDFPRSALVIGLGRPGELTRTRLTDSVTEALLHHAVDVADGTPTDEVHTLQISPMLIGTRGTTPLRVDISVAAIVDGVLAANSRLLELRTRDRRPLLARVRYDAIEFIELHLDRAEVAAHAVARIGPLVAKAPRHSRLRPLARLAKGQGGWPGQLAVDEDPGWRRILIRGSRPGGGDGPLTLTYTSVGHTSLSEALEIQPNERVVASLLARVDSSTSAAIAPTLLDALVPEALRDDLLVADNIQFIVDHESARYPWEALVVGREGAAATPASQRGGLIRQFVHTEAGHRRPRGTEARSAVVIGNPPTDLATLHGAWSEALDVSRLLAAKSYRVVTLNWDGAGQPEHDDPLELADPSAQIFHALTFPHRILHIAAHGAADDGNEPGVIVGPGNARLRARDIGELSTIPELVTLNCCHLGADPGLAANLARAFMERGAQAVIAAAWAVDDGSAAAFAEAFYGSMLGGATFGVAAHEARNAAAAVADGSLTWAAYQCYGDPGYRLEARRRSTSVAESTISESELARQIEITIARAGDIGRSVGDPQEDERTRQIGQLEQLLADAEAEDGADGRRPKLHLTAFALSRAAFAFSELGAYDIAVEWYRRAIAQERASFPMTALEQLGNMEIRLAQQLHRRSERRSCRGLHRRQPPAPQGRALRRRHGRTARADGRVLQEAGHDAAAGPALAPAAPGDRLVRLCPHHRRRRLPTAGVAAVAGHHPR